MKTSTRHSPHFDHLFKIGVLHGLATSTTADPAVREEARESLAYYRAQGEQLLRQRKEALVAKKRKQPAAADTEEQVFSGKGIIFAVIDDREDMQTGRVSTIDVIAEAIEGALDAGHETSEAIARHLVTSAFQHIPDKRVRFNSVLKAGDVVGAQITRKLYNAYNELAELATMADDAAEKATLKAEATGFAEAVQVVISPFSCEDPEDPRLVNWDMIDHTTELFETEQRQVRKVRKGNPQ